MSQVQRPMYIWEGLYETLEEAETKGTGFASERWIERINGQLINYRKENEENSLVMPPRMTDLPILAALIDAKRIIDFGGSSGWAYDFLQKTIIQNTIKEYIIVEIEEVVTHMKVASLHSAPVLYISDTNNFFNYKIKDDKVDIFYTNSVLQYIYDDAVMLKLIEKIQPKWLLIEDFMGGDFDSYFSIQNYYESKIPIYFRNRKNFINSLNEYNLVLSKPYATKILGIAEGMPMENFPINKRVRYGESMIFQRKKSSND